MGASKRGVRDGSGPYKGSYQRKSGGGTGRRKAAGQPCPKAPKRATRKK